MYKHLFFLFLFVGVISTSKAQKANNGISINSEASIPFYQNNPGFGFFIKGFYGTGKAAQFTLSAGVSTFKLKTSLKEEEVITRLIPFLVGYKLNIHKFFIEPKIGLGELGGRIYTDGDYSRPSVAAVFGGLGAGYTIKQINVGINFQTAHGIENSSAGIWYNRNFHYTSVFVGYTLMSKKRK